MKKGDNLSTVAQKYGVSVSDIIKANNIKNPNKVNVGTKLVIPPKTKKYTVQKGDTLTGIAKKFGTTVAALKSTNNIKDTDKLYIGKILVIPNGSASNTNIKPATNTAQKPAPNRQHNSLNPQPRLRNRHQSRPQPLSMRKLHTSGLQKGLGSLLPASSREP